MDVSTHTWSSPVLITYGDVEEITAKDKNFDGDDGFTLEGEPVGS